MPDAPGRRRHDAESPELTSDSTWPKRIAGGRHEFIGFGEAYRQPPDGYAQRVMAGLPAAWSQRNATLAPLKPSGRKQWSGGVRGEDGYLTRLSLHRGHGADRSAAVVEPAEAFRPIQMPRTRMVRRLSVRPFRTFHSRERHAPPRSGDRGLRGSDRLPAHPRTYQGLAEAGARPAAPSDRAGEDRAGERAARRRRAQRARPGL